MDSTTLFFLIITLIAGGLAGAALNLVAEQEVEEICVHSGSHRTDRANREGI